MSGTVSLDGVKVRVQVDRATLNAVLDSISASLRLETRGAQFEDTSGNAAPQADAELAIGDDSPPRLVSASVISPDTVLVVFHEDLDGSTVQPSDFEVGGLAPVFVSEERGTVTLKLDAQYDERAAPTVSLAGSVSDLFGNAQNSGSVQSVNNIVRVTVSEFTVSASGGLAVAGEQVSISFRATEPVRESGAVHKRRSRARDAGRERLHGLVRRAGRLAAGPAVRIAVRRIEDGHAGLVHRAGPDRPQRLGRYGAARDTLGVGERDRFGHDPVFRARAGRRHGRLGRGQLCNVHRVRIGLGQRNRTGVLGRGRDGARLGGTARPRRARPGRQPGPGGSRQRRRGHRLLHRRARPACCQ